jgi:outer membrane lipoprotein-sorting protein
MKRVLAFLGLLLAAHLAPAPARAQMDGHVNFTADQKAMLDKISAYLNGIKVIKSGFIQLGPQGQMDQGEFLLEKPGKLRFEYSPPNQTLVVATGGNVYIKNGRLNTVDRYRLSNTPLGLLLTDNVDLKNSLAVRGLDIQPDALVLHARTFDNQQQGVITMVFSNPGIELRQWTVKDNQGGTTMVALRNKEAVTGPLDETLFAIPVKDPPRTKP